MGPGLGDTIGPNGNYKNLSRFISILKNPYSSDIPEEFIKEPTNEEKVYETFCGT